MLEIRKKLLRRAIPPAPFKDIKPISSLRRQNLHLNAYFTFVVVIAGSSRKRDLKFWLIAIRFFYTALSKLDPIHFLQWFCTLTMSFPLSPFTPIRSICFCSHTFSLRGRGARWKVGGLTIENNFFILKIEKRNKIIVFDFQKVGAGAQKSGGAAALPAPPPPRSLSLTFHTCHLNIPQSRGPGSEQGQSGNEKNYASAREVLTWLSSRCRWSIHAKIKKILTWNYAHFNLYIATWGSLFHPYLLGFSERKQWGY